MHPELGPLLRCPECHEPLEFTAARADTGMDRAFGVLRCRLHAYPVIDGIPVLRRGRVSVQDHVSELEDVPGPTVVELVAMVTGDNPVDALVRLLSFPPTLPLHLERVPIVRLPLTRGPGHRLGMRRREAEIRAALRTVSEQTAQDWLRRSYLRSRNVNPEFYQYFLHRFAEPRYLSTLTLLQALPESDKPVLDMACGFGHLLFHLAARERPVTAVGVDRNFFQLWIASRFIAPEQMYVCADAAVSLPFGDHHFRASVCTDAFHLFGNRDFALAELRRCADLQTVFLDRVANGALEPHDVPGEPTLDGYHALVGETPHRIVDQETLVADYLAGRGPQLAEPMPDDLLRQRKWLSVVTRTDESLFTDHGPVPYPPHAVGPLAVNPIYRRDRGGDTLTLTFAFPTPWFEFENREMREYHADRVTLSTTDLAGLDESRLRELIDRFVILALPPKYLRNRV